MRGKDNPSSKNGSGSDGAEGVALQAVDTSPRNESIFFFNLFFGRPIRSPRLAAFHLCSSTICIRCPEVSSKPRITGQREASKICLGAHLLGIVLALHEYDAGEAWLFVSTSGLLKWGRFFCDRKMTDLPLTSMCSHRYCKRACFEPTECDNMLYCNFQWGQ